MTDDPDDKAVDAKALARREAFAKAYARNQSLAEACAAVMIPPWLMVRDGVPFLYQLATQRLILSYMRGPAKVALAEKWQLDPNTGTILEPLTLMDRIAAAREQLAIEALEKAGEPVLIEVVAPVVSARTLRRHAWAAARRAAARAQSGEAA